MNSSPPESYFIRNPNGVFKIASRAVSLCALLITSHNTAHALPILTSGSVENTLTLVTPANTFSLTTTATSPLGIFNQALVRTGFMNYSDGVGYYTYSQDAPGQYATGAAVEIDLAPYVVSPADGAGAADSYAYVGRGVFGYAGPYMNGSEEYYTLGEARFRWSFSSFGTMSGTTSQAVGFEITTDVPMGRVWLDELFGTAEVTLANSLPVGSHWFLVEFNPPSEQITGTPESLARYESNGNFGWGVNVSTVPEPSAYAIALAGLACSGYSIWRRRKRVGRTRSPTVAASLAMAALFLGSTLAHAVTIDMVRVGTRGTPTTRRRAMEPSITSTGSASTRSRSSSMLIF